MSAVLSEMITILTDGITEFAQGIGSGLQNLVQSMFLVEGTGGTQTLSTFGGITLAFAGISLAIGLSTLIFNWLTGLGK